jgi:hypothetical protein
VRPTHAWFRLEVRDPCIDPDGYQDAPDDFDVVFENVEVVLNDENEPVLVKKHQIQDASYYDAIPPSERWRYGTDHLEMAKQAINHFFEPEAEAASRIKALEHFLEIARADHDLKNGRLQALLHRVVTKQEGT